MYQLPVTFICLSIFIFALGYQKYYLNKQGYYRCSTTGWLSVKDHPIPEDIRGFIATDGNKVEYIYGLEWGPYGKVFMNKYEKTFITHWQPLPEPPK